MDSGITQVDAVILKALGFRMDAIIRRYAKDKGISVEIASEHAHELKKFLALCSLHPERRYEMSPVIDELWHTFIWFTRDYHRFCTEVAGHYIHHQPLIKDESIGNQTHADYCRLIDDYRNYFGEPPTHIWPSSPSEVSDDCSGCSSENRCRPGCSAPEYSVSEL